MACIDGLTAGIIDGMMGFMLGVMLQPKSIDVMIYFIDVVFVLVIVLLIRMIDEETNTQKSATFVRKPLIGNPFVLVALMVFMGVIVVGKDTLFPINGNQVSSEPNDFKFTSSSQIQEVEVKPTEYSPNNIVLKAGTPSIINFNTKEVGCTGIVLSDELGFNVSLKVKINNYINIKALKPGIYHLAYEMGIYKEP